MPRSDPWIIVGAGASGCAAAFFLKQLGIDSELVESQPAIGGRMGTMRLGDRVLDCGGKNIGRRYRLFRQFAASLGTHPLEYFGLNSSQVVDGKVRTFEESARWRTLLDVVRGLPARDIARLARLIWRVRSSEDAGYLGSGWSRALAARYDSAAASRYFSREFSQRIIRPMSVRMNGAEPDEVYVGNLPSNVRMLLDTYEQFTNGLGPLLDSFASRYRVHTGTTADALVVERGRVVGVRIRDAAGRTSERRGDGVIVALPAHAAARLVEPVLPRLAERLRTIAYFPVALAVAEYDGAVFTPSMRAVVFDERHALSNAGAYGVNDLQLVRYTFSGRTAREAIGGIADEALVELGERALATCVPVGSRRRRRFVVKRFDPGLCAYAPHHARLVERMQEELRTLPGLQLTGDYIQGASIEACFRAASTCVRQLARASGVALARPAAAAAAAL